MIALKILRRRSASASEIKNPMCIVSDNNLILLCSNNKRLNDKDFLKLIKYWVSQSFEEWGCENINVLVFKSNGETYEVSCSLYKFDKEDAKKIKESKQNKK